jgi:aspartate racemase
VPSSKRPFFYLGWGLDKCPGGLGTDQPIYWLPVSIILENSTTFIKDLAALYVEEICAIQPDGPYLLGGHCFGAWVAFEIAQQLQVQGQKVALLVLLDRGGTHPLYLRYQHHIYRLTHNWRNLWRLSPYQKLTYLLELAMRIRNRMVSKDQRKQGSADISNDYREQVLKTFAESRKNYIVQPYLGKVALFFAQESGRRSFIFPKGGWGKILTGEVEVHVVPGDHTSCLEEPNVWVLAKKLKTCLDKAQIDISNDNY